MRNSHKILGHLIAITVVAVAAHPPVSASAGGAQIVRDQATKDAVQAAGSKWVALVDARKYDASWDAASPQFQNAVAKGQWVTTLSGYRTPLGDVTSRKLRTIEFSDMLPNLPPGEYAAVTNETAFATKPKAIELIVLVLEADGAWRVIGYWINDVPPGG
jgi:hypothetical protein